MKPFSLNIRGRLFTYDRPAVMGILNVTPDSFYSGSRTPAKAEIEQRLARMLDSGVDIIDIGGYSSRPGADDVSPDEEMRRLALGLSAVRAMAPGIPVSVDTFRARVAHHAVAELGADIINDISGGALDADMFSTVADLNVPYILMHMRGTPATMQQYTDYSDYGGNVAAGVIAELSDKVATLARLGINDIIIDPGFGFSKTLEQNYQLLRDMQTLDIFDRPVLVGVSRKSMIFKALGCTPLESLNGTSVINTMALERGASILRVHDVAEARQCVDLVARTLGDY